MTNTPQEEESPFIPEGQPDPGCFEPNPQGRSLWTGKMCWKRKYGESVIEFTLGRATRAYNVLLPEHVYGDVQRLMIRNTDRHNGQDPETLKGWRYTRANGYVVRGSLVRNNLLSSLDTFSFVEIPIRLATNDTEQNAAENNNTDAYAVISQNMKNHANLMAVIQDDIYARQLYAAFCNVTWLRKEQNDQCEEFHGKEFQCSWRAAGRLVAELRGRNEEYIDFYLSGDEGNVAEWVANLLDECGWIPVCED